MQIKDVVEMTQTSAYTLRYYEKEGLLFPDRTTEGIRDYDVNQVARIRVIQHYRRAGLSLAEIRQVFDGLPEPELLKILYAAKDRLLTEQQEINDSLDYVDYKIRVHRDDGKGEDE